MKCFYSQDSEANGICKSCGRALSKEFTTEFERGLACKDRCEDDVKALIGLIDDSVATKDATKNYMAGSTGGLYGAALFLVVMGAVCTFFGMSRDDKFSFITIMGFVFLGFGIWQLIRARKVIALARNFDPTAGR